MVASRGVGGPGVLTGSHLDSVLDGGAYDGPLGVVSALAAIDVLRERGFAPAKPVGVSVFAEEEGSRFGLACLGSRLATGAMPWAKARELRDRDGVFLPDALGDSGLAPTDGDKVWDLGARIDCFVELHVEQGRDLVDRGAAVGVASEIWPHGRYRFDFAGEANHAGTTRMEDRRDPMLTYAMTALAANKQARLAGERATFGRVEVAPNGTNAVPSRVTAWLDARCATDEGLATLVAAVEKQASERAGRDGTSLSVVAESVSGSWRSTLISPGGSLPTTKTGTGRSSRPWPATMPGSCQLQGSRPRCCSCATRPECRTRRPSMPRWPTAWWGSRRWPTRWRGWRRDCDVGVGVPAGAGVGGWCRALRCAGGGGGRSVHVRHTSHGFRSLPTRCFPGERGFPGDPGKPRRIPGLTIPGLANCHSHAFHRALRGRTQRERGTFWTWRDRMYDVAATLDPDSYFTLARATYREMAAAGITCVGEFHYLHHQPDGTPYDDPNAMGHALVEAAREAGIRIALLDTSTSPAVRRAARRGAAPVLRWVGPAMGDAPDDHQLERDGVVLGSAIHSVRAVPADQFQRVAEWGGRPLHVHLSEQVAENQACVAEYARTPTEVLADHELLGPDTTVVHATHLTADDIRLLGSTGTNACICPTTERDLGDGIGPAGSCTTREPCSRSAATATR